MRFQIKTIEFLDNRIVKYLMEETAKMKEDVAIGITPDHGTPCDIRTHVHDPVPFLIYRPGDKADNVTCYDEVSTEGGSYGIIKGDAFIRALLNR